MEGVEYIFLVVQYLSRWELWASNLGVCARTHVCVHVCNPACLRRVAETGVEFAAFDRVVPVAL